MLWSREGHWLLWAFLSWFPALSQLLLSPAWVQKWFFLWDDLGHMKSIPFPSGLPCPGLVALQVLCALGRVDLPDGVMLGGEEQWEMNTFVGAGVQARGVVWNPLKQIQWDAGLHWKFGAWK